LNYLLKKLLVNRTAYQGTVRTRLSSYHKTPDFIARRVIDWYSICIKMQNMLVKVSRNVLTIALCLHIFSYFI